MIVQGEFSLTQQLKQFLQNKKHPKSWQILILIYKVSFDIFRKFFPIFSAGFSVRFWTDFRAGLGSGFAKIFFIHVLDLACIWIILNIWKIQFGKNKFFCGFVIFQSGFSFRKKKCENVKFDTWNMPDAFLVRKLGVYFSIFWGDN